MRKLKIDVLCNDGSPLGTSESDIFGHNGRIGLGGAELALMTLCSAWTELGHNLTLYNNPNGGSSSFRQANIDDFHPKDSRDILIVFRSPNHRIHNAKGKKIWWSCDQYTIGDFAQFSNEVDKIITISEFHAEFFKNRYVITDTTIIDLPVRSEDYLVNIQSIKNRLIFCSVPDRGLGILASIFPKVKKEIPDASLVITSDYRLWGVPDPRNEQYIRRFLGMDGVQFIGAVRRDELIQEQLKAEIQAYPCTYDELFCYAVAECQVAGAYPITSDQGALKTTNMGTIIPDARDVPEWTDKFANKIITTLNNPRLEEMQKEVQYKAMERFSLRKVLGKWDKVFYE